MKFVLTCVPAIGHALPMIYVGAQLRNWGHDVYLVSGKSIEELAVSANLSFIPLQTATYQSSQDFFADCLPTYIEPEPAVMLRMIDLLPQTYHETEDVILRIAPDFLLVDSATYAGAAVARRHNIVWATSCVFPDMLPTKTCLPLEYRLSNSPNNDFPSTEVTRLCESRNRELASLFDNAINDFLATLGLKATSPAALNANISPYLIICYTVKELEHLRKDWPPQVLFVGPDRWDLPRKEQLKVSVERGLAYVTLGTFWNHYMAHRFDVVLRALCDFDGTIIVSTGGAQSQSLAERSDRIIVRNYVSQWDVLPKADFVIHHGGFGTAMAVLMSGTPSLVWPMDRSDYEMATKLRDRGLAYVVLDKDVEETTIQRQLHKLQQDKAMLTRLKEIQQDLKESRSSADAAQAILTLAAKE